ncbi:hypothetical protein KGQ19_41750, partial [Catenulispora sp. NL8]
GRGDGRPAGGVIIYRLLIALAVLALPFIFVFDASAMVGAQRSADDREGYLVSWPLCCAIGGLATVVFYASVRPDRHLPSATRKRIGRNGSRTPETADSPSPSC